MMSTLKSYIFENDILSYSFWKNIFPGQRVKVNSFLSFFFQGFILFLSVKYFMNDGSCFSFLYLYPSEFLLSLIFLSLEEVDQFWLYV